MKLIYEDGLEREYKLVQKIRGAKIKNKRPVQALFTLKEVATLLKQAEIEGPVSVAKTREYLMQIYLALDVEKREQLK